MPGSPRYLCPRCGFNLRTTSTEACPECGFYVGPARVQHRGAVRYWLFRRAERRLDLLVVVLWLVAMILCWCVISLHPTTAVKVVAVGGGASVVALGYYLRFRRGKAKS